MVERATAWLGAINFPTRAERRQAIIIQIILLGLIVAAFLWLPISIAAFTTTTGRLLTALSSVVVVALTAVGIWVIRHGHVQLGVLFSSASLVIAATIVLMITGLPQSGALLFVLSTPIALVSLLVGRRWMVLFLLISIGIVLVVATLQSADSRLFQYGSLDHPLGIVGTFALAGSMLCLILDQFGISLRDALSTALRRERELEEIRASLEQMVEARTAELRVALDEAQQNRLAAEAANYAKSEFLSRMSHELRTPMNAILGFGQILQLQELQPQQRKHVGSILKSGRHLLDLINEVLDITRIESGHLTISVEPIALGGLLHDVFDLAQPLADEKGITLETSALDLYGSYIVRGDYQRLKQVLINLLSNAIKYNRPQGSVTLRCDEVPDSEILRISIIDTGQGIPAEKLGQLFQPFSRLGQERSTIEGVGLGLALSKYLVELMGGEMGVNSVEGEGSTFWLTLPLDQQVVLQQPLDQATPRATLDAAPSLVLYIEDNASNLAVIKEVLAMHSAITLITATSGEEGLRLAAEHHPNVILLDVHLPDLMGHEVLQRLRGQPDTKEIPVVVLSADATKQQMRRLLNSGAQEYLTKPVDVHELLQVLEEQLRRNGLD